LQERGDLDQSIVLPRHALGIEPGFPEALKNLARVQRVAGDAAVAADLARRSQAGSEPGRDSVEARLD
jgi:hypothetical protein